MEGTIFIFLCHLCCGLTQNPGNLVMSPFLLLDWKDLMSRLKVFEAYIEFQRYNETF